MSTVNIENKLTTRPPIRKFSPGMYQSDEEVISQFVVRNHELKIILDVLYENIKSSSCQHLLVIAPRGRGKTMLLSRVAAELRVNYKFSENLLPVQFMEESQEIFTLADFWLETLFHLAREITANNPELAQELRETYAALTDRWQEREIGDQARATVLAAVDQLGSKLVLIVENLQALCESVDEDFGWKLREALQSEPKIMLLASATSRFESLDDVEQPFFELFRIVSLERLATSDCQLLWEAISGKEASAREVRPLEILTGGNPRLLVIIAEFARHGSIRQLMEELVALIDEHTEYFRSHLENFPNMERRVYLAVIDLWQPSKPSEIAVRARMDVRKVSTMLGRLIDRGAIIVEGSGKKRLYVAAGRLYSIYYKLHRERDEAVLVQNLIYFMIVFYTETELTEISSKLIAEATQSRVIREGIERAIAKRSDIEDSFPHMEWKTIQEISNQVSENHRFMSEKLTEEEIDTALEKRNFKKAIKIIDQVLTSQGKSPSPTSEPKTAELLYKKVVAYGQLADFEAVVTICNEMVELFGKSSMPNLQSQVRAALARKGNALEELGDFQAAITAYDEVVKRFGNSNSPNLYMDVAWSILRRGNALDKLGDPQAAITAYDEVVKRFGNSNVTQTQWQVARAILLKGDILDKLGDPQAAITAYDEVVKRFGNSNVTQTQWQVAWAILHKGNALDKLSDPQAAITAYDEVVKRFGNSNVMDLEWEVAWAILHKGNALDKLSDPQAAITAYDKVVKHFGDSEATDLQRIVAWSILRKGNALDKLGDSQAAITVYDEVVKRSDNSNVMDLKGEVAWAIIHKGDALDKLGDSQAAITAYDEVAKRFGNRDVQDTLFWASTALLNKAQLLTKIHRSEEALSTCEEVEQRLDILNDTESINLGWQAMYVKTLALIAQKKHGAAMDTFRSMYAKFVPSNEVMMHKMLQIVPDMIAIGFPVQDLIDILSSNDKKSDALTPLIIALHQHGGESIRAPEEVLDVAADIRKRIIEKTAKHGTSTDT